MFGRKKWQGPFTAGALRPHYIRFERQPTHVCVPTAHEPSSLDFQKSADKIMER